MCKRLKAQLARYVVRRQSTVVAPCMPSWRMRLKQPGSLSSWALHLLRLCQRLCIGKILLYEIPEIVLGKQRKQSVGGQVPHF